MRVESIQTVAVGIIYSELVTCIVLYIYILKSGFLLILFSPAFMVFSILLFAYSISNYYRLAYKDKLLHLT